MRQVLNIPLKMWVMPSVVKSSVMQWAAVKTVLDNCSKKGGKHSDTIFKFYLKHLLEGNESATAKCLRDFVAVVCFESTQSYVVGKFCGALWHLGNLK